MRKDCPRYTLRIQKELLDKLTYTAEINSRTKNREIENVLKKYIADYERLYGRIDLQKKKENLNN